jgi:hypothetical protein
LFTRPRRFSTGTSPERHPSSSSASDRRDLRNQSLHPQTMSADFSHPAWGVRRRQNKIGSARFKRSSARTPRRLAAAAAAAKPVPRPRGNARRGDRTRGRIVMTQTCHVRIPLSGSVSAALKRVTESACRRKPAGSDAPPNAPKERAHSGVV